MRGVLLAAPKLKAIRFLPAVVWASAIFWSSSQPRLPTPPFGFEGLDKLVHAAVYAVLALLLVFADHRPTGRRAWLWVGVACLYGLSDEIHQSFVPPRQVEGLDLAADIAGAMGSVALWQRFGPRRRSRALRREGSEA
ncbi:MAG: VanZ family protein [Myxococcota bacterium]